MTTAPILYLGDTTLRSAAAYLAGVMTHAGWTFAYTPSDQSAPESLFNQPFQLVILSDYPAKNLTPQAQARLLARVQAGAGLLMIGGWESYTGVGGDWGPTSVGAALPVQMQDHDDRVNCDQPTLIHCRLDHPITAGLPWVDRPPTIGGFNRFTAKPEAQTLLEAQRFAASRTGAGFTFKPLSADALLVVGTHGQGRTTALATDVAPHWVGGLVDWGSDSGGGPPGRVSAQAPHAEAIEVGDHYAQFFRQLLQWTGKL